MKLKNLFSSFNFMRELYLPMVVPTTTPVGNYHLNYVGVVKLVFFLRLLNTGVYILQNREVCTCAQKTLGDPVCRSLDLPSV